MLLRICFNFLQEYPLGYRGYVMFLEHFHNNVSKTKELIGTLEERRQRHTRTLFWLTFIEGQQKGLRQDTSLNG